MSGSPIQPSQPELLWSPARHSFGDGARSRLKSGMTPNGFTIIELLIVVIVLGTLFAAGSASFRGHQRRQQLEAQANILAGALRQAQLYAYTGRIDGMTRPASYGVHVLSVTTYVLFADAAAAGDPLRYDAADTVVEPFALPPSVTFEGVGVPIEDMDIVFAVPHGPVYVNGEPSPPAPSEQRLRLADSLSSATKDVVVNGVSGQVEIE